MKVNISHEEYKGWTDPKADMYAEIIAKEHGVSIIDAIELARINRILPVQFTDREGGDWIEWHHKQPPDVVNAIEFDNGMTLDPQNGWRGASCANLLMYEEKIKKEFTDPIDFDTDTPAKSVVWMHDQVKRLYEKEFALMAETVDLLFKTIRANVNDPTNNNAKLSDEIRLLQHDAVEYRKGAAKGADFGMTKMIILLGGETAQLLGGAE